MVLPLNIESRISRTGTCWLWTGTIKPNGYGALSIWKDGKSTGYYAHRLVYELLIALIPEGLQIDHTCRVRHCVNPDHLELVTPTENVRRSVAFISGTSTTQCRNGHEYTEDNTFYYSNGSRHFRQCRQCLRAADKRRYEKFKEKLK